MKTLSLLFVVLLSASPLFAQQSEPASVSELSKLRQGYVDSLNRLLQQYVESNDVAAAATVSQELDRLAQAKLRGAPDLSPCGVWSWLGNSTTTVTDDHVAVNRGYGSRGVWHWVDESKHEFQIEWQSGFVDTLKISPDGTRVQFVNNQGTKCNLERLSSSEKAVASIATR